MRAASCFLFLVLGLPCLARTQHSESGSIGVYADSLHGRPTASGALYDRNLLSAAHADLPFGTVVRVANFQSGKMVDVQVNDRKPRDGNLLVLSGAAARSIDLSGQALAPGALLVLGQARAPAAGPNTPSIQSILSPSNPSPAVPTQATERKFRPLAGFFEKGVAPPATPPVATTPSAPSLFGIPTNRTVPTATNPTGFLGQTAKKGGLFAAKPSVPTSAYPNPFPVLQNGVSAPKPNELLAMNAPVGRPALPAPASNVTPPTAPALALPPASPGAPYRVQFGAFRRVSSADELSSMLDGAGIPTSVFAAPVTGLNVVVTDAGFRSAEEAQGWIDFEGSRRGWTERPVVIR